MHRLINITLIVISFVVIAYFVNVARQEQRAASAALEELRNAQQKIAELEVSYASVTNLPEYRIGQKARALADQTRKNVRSFVTETEKKVTNKLNALLERMAN